MVISDPIPEIISILDGFSPNSFYPIVSKYSLGSC